MSITIDIDDLTIGELEELEEITGRTLDAYFSGGGFRPDAKALTALVFLTLRRQNPDATLDDARAVKFSDLSLSGADPTDAAG